MYMMIELYNADKDKFDFIPAVFKDRTTACVYAQDYIKDHNTMKLFYRVLNCSFIDKDYLKKHD